ncbi:MAG: hypothetical protein LBV40_08265 [Methanomicrobiales archaeon]|jgi:hypothetical protein|nr:hypothetical protein [Methanomicrobiales archaeon]
MEETEYFDLIFPPGTPQTVIRDIINTFDVKLVDRAERITFANMDGDVRNLIAARGTRDEMIRVEAFYKEKMEEFLQNASSSSQ